MNFALVTGIFNVRDKIKSPSKRSVKMYQHLIKYLYDLDVPLFIYADNDSIKDLKEKDNVHLMRKEIEDLEIYQYLKNNSKSDVGYINDYPYGNMYYFSVINSKMDLLKETNSLDILNKLYPEITHLVWIDAGISHVNTIDRNDFISGIISNSYTNKITTIMMKATSPNEIINLHEFLKFNRDKIAAGLSIVPRNKIDWYSKELKNLNMMSINQYNLFCLEEQLIAVLITKHPEEFEYIFSDYWSLPNLKKITTKIEFVINNLEYCRVYGLNEIGYKILLKLLESISYGRNITSTNSLYEILYNGQIISFYKNKELCKKLSLFLGYLYHNKIDAKKWIDSKYDNIRSNLSFMGLDLSRYDQFNEDYIFKIDDTFILWSGL